MLTSYQANENQNYKERSLHTCQNGCNQQVIKSVGKVVEEKEPSFTTGENAN